MNLYLENPKYNAEYLKLMNITENENVENYVVNAIGEEQYKKYLKELNLDYEEFKEKGIIVDVNKVQYINDEDKNATKYIRKYTYSENENILGQYYNDEGTMLNLGIDIGLVTDKLPFGLTKDLSYIIVSDEFYEKLDMKYNDIFVFMDSTNPDKLQDEIEEILKDENYNINNINENVKMMTNLYVLVGIFLYGFIIVISLI